MFEVDMWPWFLGLRGICGYFYDGSADIMTYVIHLFSQCKHPVGWKVSGQDVRLRSHQGVGKMHIDHYEDREDCGYEGIHGAGSTAGRNYTEIGRLQLRSGRISADVILFPIKYLFCGIFVILSLALCLQPLHPHHFLSFVARTDALFRPHRGVLWACS